MFRPHAITASFLVFLLIPSQGKVDEIYVFGDSLSDAGNINAISFGLVPSDAYWESRSFSNGPTWVTTLAEELGVSTPVHSLSGSQNATNYAYGGAESGEEGSAFAGITVQNIGPQIDEFIADDRALRRSSLVILWIGGNDLNGTSASGASNQISRTIRNVRHHLEELISLGAVQFLIPNVPLLGEVPQHNQNPSDRAQQNQLTEDYNEALATLVGEIRTDHPSLRFVEFNVAALMRDALANPLQFGFTNTTDQAHTPGALGGIFGGMTVPNPDEYVFWDDLHPTGPVHEIAGVAAAERLKSSVLPPALTITKNAEALSLAIATNLWEDYTLEFSTELETWTPFQTGIQGTGEFVTVPLEPAAKASKKFFRARVEP